MSEQKSKVGRPNWISQNADRSDLVLVTVGDDDAVVVVERCSNPEDWRLGYRNPPVVVVETERLLSETEVEESLSKAWDAFKALDGER